MRFTDARRWSRRVMPLCSKVKAREDEMRFDMNVFCECVNFWESLDIFWSIPLEPTRGLVESVPVLVLRRLQGHSEDSSQVFHRCWRAAPPPIPRVIEKAKPSRPRSLFKTSFKEFQLARLDLLDGGVNNAAIKGRRDGVKDREIARA